MYKSSMPKTTQLVTGADGTKRLVCWPQVHVSVEREMTEW